MSSDRAARYETPWQRLKWTGPIAVLAWSFALWAMSLVLNKTPGKLEREQPIEARFIELPEPKVEPPPTMLNPIKAPTPRPQKPAARVTATESAPAVEQPSTQPSSVEIAESSLKPSQDLLPGVAAPRPTVATGSPRHPGTAVRSEAVGVVDRPINFSVHDEENPFDMGKGEGSGLGGLMFNFSDEREPFGETVGTQVDFSRTFFTTPPTPICHNRIWYIPSEIGTCHVELKIAVAAYQRQDYAFAFAEFKRLAELDYEPAQASLGAMYAEGVGMPKDDQKAVYWWRRAAKDGEPKAVYNLALMYSDGRGVTKDDTQAAYWYRKAAYYGNSDAQYNLGVLYFHGTGVPKDDKMAAYWYRKAADRGNVNAQYNLGAMYADGVGVKKNEKYAVQWFCRSAFRGDARGRHSLALMVGNGADAASNGELAYFCWMLSLPKRNRDLVEVERVGLVKRLTPQQRANAEAAASIWMIK